MEDVDLYGYCVSDPINWTDPTGLDSDAAVITGAGASTGILGAAWSYVSLPVGEVIAVSAFASSALIVASGVAGYIGGKKLIVEGSWLDGGLGIWLYDLFYEDEDALPNACYYKPHRKGKRKSTQPKHDKGDKRRDRDKPGGEKGDKRRRYRR